jgi:hypothetical protein
MSLLEGVDIKALCDIVPAEAEKVRKQIEFAALILLNLFRRCRCLEEIMRKG